MRYFRAVQSSKIHYLNGNLASQVLYFRFPPRQASRVWQGSGSREPVLQGLLKSPSLLNHKTQRERETGQFLYAAATTSAHEDLGLPVLRNLFLCHSSPIQVPSSSLNFQRQLSQLPYAYKLKKIDYLVICTSKIASGIDWC